MVKIQKNILALIKDNCIKGTPDNYLNQNIRIFELEAQMW